MQDGKRKWFALYLLCYYNAALWSQPRPGVDQSENILVTAQLAAWRGLGAAAISQLWGENWYNLWGRPAVDFNPPANLLFAATTVDPAFTQYGVGNFTLYFVPLITSLYSPHFGSKTVFCAFWAKMSPVILYWVQHFRHDEDARLHQPPVPSLTNRCIIPNIVFCVLWVVSGRGHNKTGHWDLSRLYQSYISVISALYRHVVSKLQWSSVPKLRAAAWWVSTICSWICDGLILLRVLRQLGLYFSWVKKW